MKTCKDCYHFSVCQAERVAASPGENCCQFEDASRTFHFPCAVGDVVYKIDSGNYATDYKPLVRAMEVSEITWKKRWQKDHGWGIIASGNRYKMSNCGRTWFIDREDAETALKKMEKADG